MRKLLLTISLFATALHPTTALCQTAKPDSTMQKDTIQAVRTTPKDSIPLILTNRMLKEVVVFKRSMNTGYAGVQNPLFFNENTVMCFGDAKGTVDEILAELKK